MLSHSDAVISVEDNQFIKVGTDRLHKQGEKQIKTRMMLMATLFLL